MALIPLRAPRGPLVEAPQGISSQPRTIAAEPPKQIVIEIGDGGDVDIQLGHQRRKRQSTNKRFDANLAEEMDDQSLFALAQYVIESVEADEQDRREWEDTANQASAYLGIKLENPTAAPVSEDGTVCRSVATCLLEALIKLWSTAYAELLPSEGPVKVARKDAVPVTPPSGVGGDASQGLAGIGDNGGPPMEDTAPDVTSKQADDDIADALERDMNWYLTVGDRGYYQDFSKMLLHRALIGPQFREVYDCPILDKPLSRWVRAQDFIVAGDPPHLSESKRHTVRKRVSQGTMRRMMVAGHYRNIPLNTPTGIASPTEIVVSETMGIAATPSLPRDYDHVVYQCHCELGAGTAGNELGGALEMLDLDETGNDPGYPLPYIVTVDIDSRAVLRISRAWEKGDKRHRREPRFVKYSFIPGFGFYDFGLIHLVGNPTQSATMLERSCVDAGIYANFPAWLAKQGAGTKWENSIWRLQPGEVLKIPVTGSDKLSDAIMPVPREPPSSQALEMAAALEGKVKAIAGVIEIPVGEGRIGNTPVGTIMSYIESTTMVPGAVHKADHVSQSEEYSMLRKRLAKRPKILWRDNPKPARKWQVGRELHSVDLSPASDPNTPSVIHRLLKVQGRVQLAAQPQFAPIANQRAIYIDALNAMGGEADKFTNPPAPMPAMPPDPKLLVAQTKAQSDQTIQGMKTQDQQAETQAKMAQAKIESQDREADRQAANQREAMKTDLQMKKTGADLTQAGATAAHDAQQAHLDRGHEAAIQQQDHAIQQQQAVQQQQADQQAQQADHAQAVATSSVEKPKPTE